MSDSRALEAIAEIEDRFEERIADLEEQVDDLERELQEERDRRRRAERTLALVDRDARDWRHDHDLRHEASSNWKDSLEERLVDVEEQIEQVARGEVDASELVAQSQGPSVEELCPLHQLYLTATNREPHEHDLTSNQEIAARLFPHVAQYATPRGDELLLESSKVADVIEREIETPELAKRLDVDSPSRMTIARAMEFVGRFGKHLFEYYPASSDERRNSTNVLVVDRDAWTEYAGRLSDADGDSPATTSDGADPARADGGELP